MSKDTKNNTTTKGGLTYSDQDNKYSNTNLYSLDPNPFGSEGVNSAHITNNELTASGPLVLNPLAKSKKSGPNQQKPEVAKHEVAKVHGHPEEQNPDDPNYDLVQQESHQYDKLPPDVVAMGIEGKEGSEANHELVGPNNSSSYWH